MTAAPSFEPALFDDVLPVADAVLYEGYALYPYRESSLKNRVRWNFGGVYPRAYSQAQSGADQCEASTQCLIIGARSELTIEARFLEQLERAAREGVEAARPRSFRREFGGLAALAGCTVEAAFSRGRLHASLELRVQALEGSVFRIHAVLRNESNCPAVERADALADTLLAAHLLLAVRGGEFVSQIDPPTELRRVSRACQQGGLWPVLAGDKARRDRLLASPIILYDYPQIAPESRADSCDATEIDEILLLRVLTLSDSEKAELRQGDARCRAILARAEALSAGDDANGVARTPAEVDAGHEQRAPHRPTSTTAAEGARGHLRHRACWTRRYRAHSRARLRGPRARERHGRRRPRCRSRNTGSAGSPLLFFLG